MNTSSQTSKSPDDRARCQYSSASVRSGGHGTRRTRQIAQAFGADRQCAKTVDAERAQSPVDANDSVDAGLSFSAKALIGHLAPAWVFVGAAVLGSILRTQRAHSNFNSEQCTGNQGTHNERLSSGLPLSEPSRDYKTGREDVTNESNLARRVAAS